MVALLVGTGAGGQRASDLTVPHTKHAFGRKLKLEGVGDFAEVTPTLYRGAQPSHAGFKSLADTWADTTTPHGRLILTVLGGLAEFERHLISERTSDGRARAKARGQHMGRPAKLNHDQQQEARARRDAGETLADIARTFGVSHTTISRL